jgi:short-subunit dehydrogenase
MSGLKNHTVVITGASSGIGLACAREFTSRGCQVVLAARNLEKLSLLEEELSSEGADVLIVKTDVSSENDCRQLIEKTLERFGKIDVLINNAGLSMRALFIDTDLQVLKTLMNVNFWGTVYCTKYALPHLLKSKGSVAGVSSIAGIHGLPARTGYSASKFAMHGFLESLRIENLKAGLHVMIVAPGFTRSNIRKLALVGDGRAQGESPRNEERMMSAEQVAFYIAKGIEKRKRTVILTAQGKTVALLKKFAPALLDKLSFNHMSKEDNSPL